MLGTGELTAKPVRINATSGRRDQRRGPGRPRQGTGQADLLGHRPGADDHPRLRPRGRRPAVLHRERGHARRHGHVGDAARRLQRGARVPVDAGQHDAVAAGGRPGDTNVKVGERRRTSSSATRSRSARRRRRSPPSGRSRAPRRCSRPPPWATRTSRSRRRPASRPATQLRIGEQTRRRSRTSARRAARRRSSAAAAAGATNIRVASVTGLVAEQRRSRSAARPRSVATVGTQGANGTGLTLAAPLAAAAAAGAAVRYDGTGITFTPALTAAQAPAPRVLAPGTGITIDAPLDRRAGRGRHRAQHARAR